MASAGFEFVDEFTSVIKKLLTRARAIKSDGGIEPALTAQNLAEGLKELEQKLLGSVNHKYAAIETACRNIFYHLLVRSLTRETGLG